MQKRRSSDLISLFREGLGRKLTIFPSMRLPWYTILLRACLTTCGDYVE